MTKDEALDLALEALEKSLPRLAPYGEQDWLDSRAAITAIKQALALDKKADNARELGLDYEPSAKVRDFWEGYVPEPVKPAPVLPVAFEVGLVEWVGNKLMATPKVTTTPPASWMEMVTANLVREGIDKHKARELAEHFYSLAQRQWVGLAEADKHEPDMGPYVYLNDDWLDGYKTGMECAEAKLKEKNNG